MTSRDSCRSPKACSRVLMSSSAPFTCSVVREIISPKPTQPSSNSAVKCSWDEQVGMTQFDELCKRFEKNYPTFNYAGPNTPLAINVVVVLPSTTWRESAP